MSRHTASPSASWPVAARTRASSAAMASRCCARSPGSTRVNASVVTGRGYPSPMARPRGARARAGAVVEGLAELYPDAHCALNHASAYQLLCATILSAQCTDERVNMVTPSLFARYPTPADLAAADPAEVETLVQSTGFFRSK